MRMRQRLINFRDWLLFVPGVRFLDWLDRPSPLPDPKWAREEQYQRAKAADADRWILGIGKNGEPIYAPKAGEATVHEIFSASTVLAKEARLRMIQLLAAQVTCCEAGQVAYPEPCPWHGTEGHP